MKAPPAFPHRLPGRLGLALALWCSSAAGAPASAPAELLGNPTLSDDKNGDGWPDGWPRGAGLAWHRHEPPELSFIRLQPVEPGKSVLLFRDLRLPSKTTSVSFLVKARAREVVIGPEPWHDARVVWEFRDGQGGKIGAAPTPLIVSRGGSKDWRVFSGKLAVPEGAVSLGVLVAMFHCESGALDIGLLEIRADEAAAD